jgi:Ca2+-binding RTX toxin-like protein
MRRCGLSARNSSTRKPWAFLVALSTVMWLAVPFVGMATAGHTATHDLECEPETAQNQVNTQHTVTCYVLDTAVSEVIRFEINSDTDGDTPITPDGTDSTCTAADAPNTTGETGGPAFDNDVTVDDCAYSFTYTGPAAARSDLIRAWIDDDSNIATTDFDTAEGRDATAVPGNIQPEPDDTDVVDKSWFSAALATATLDCDDEAGNDSDNGFAGNDTQTNPQGQSELYTCKVFNDNGAGGGIADNGIQEGSEAAIGGMVIDAENLGGANDPDTAGQPDVTTSPPNNAAADYPNACTTAANGQCTFTLTASENELGTADVCFWVDDDNDNVYSDGGNENDGGSCGEAPATEDGDLTDVVSKTWATSAATFLDVEPEFDSNATTAAPGTQHVMTATVTDQFGAPVQNAPVDWQLTGRNGAAGDGGGGPITLCDNTTTNANGQVTCTITDEGTTADPIAAPPAHEDDVVQACISANTAGFACAVPADLDGSTNEDENNDSSDQVEKFWFTSLTAIDEIGVDMDNSCSTPFAETATNSVTDTHNLCVVVQDAADNGLPGRQVQLQTSVGYFEGPNGENLGQSITRSTDQNGEIDVDINSTDSGNATITATSGSVSDTARKTWQHEEPRNIDCTPETATNPPGTRHNIICAVTDVFGNPTPGDIVTFIIDSGPGHWIETAVENENDGRRCTFQSSSDTIPARCSAVVGNDGNARATLETFDSEEGTTAVHAHILNDWSGGSDSEPDGDPDDDECNQPAGTSDEPGGDLGNDAATTPGNCFDDVTKTWSNEDVPECSNGADDDNDGETDFPDDPGCDSADDDSEGTRIVQSGPCSTFPEGSRTQRSEGGQIIVGTSGDDVLNGTGGNDIICGLNGNDIINGRGGRDQIVGNAGNDTVGGGGGKDTVRGNSGRDSLSGNSGNDVLLGGDSRDTLKGNAGIDTLRGEGGGDTLQGGDGQDVLKGGGGDDTLRGGDGADALDGGAGTDQCFGNAGSDRIRRCE